MTAGRTNHTKFSGTPRRKSAARFVRPLITVCLLLLGVLYLTSNLANAWI